MNFPRELFGLIIPAVILVIYSFTRRDLGLGDEWDQLAEAYRTDKEFKGVMVRFESGSLNSFSYRGCLTMGANSEGFYLSQVLSFKKDRMFIPWSDVEVSKDRKLLFEMICLSFSKVPNVELRIRKYAAEALLPQGPLRVPA